MTKGSNIPAVLLLNMVGSSSDYFLSRDSSKLTELESPENILSENTSSENPLPKQKLTQFLVDKNVDNSGYTITVVSQENDKLCLTTSYLILTVSNWYQLL